MPRADAAIAIDARLQTPPFVQIFEQIRASIERGDLAPGDSLPPVRQLAGDLGIAPNTVVRAYAELRAAGWVASEDRKGSRVAIRSPLLSGASRRKALAEAVATFLASLIRRGYGADEIAREVSKTVAREPRISR
jgi:GntR family transcriptional regulator